MTSRIRKIARVNEVLEYIRAHGPVNSPVVERELSMTGGEVRNCVHELRTAGYLICEGRQGYWMTNNLSEIDHTIARLRSRSNSLIEAMNGMVIGRERLIDKKVKQEMLAI